MPTYIRLARLASTSSVGTFYDVSTDGRELSCNCPGWTRQVHYADCPAVQAGGSCDCRRRARRDDTPRARTCKHIREIQTRVDRAGGLPEAIRLVTVEGIALSDGGWERRVRPPALTPVPGDDFGVCVDCGRSQVWLDNAGRCTTCIARRVNAGAQRAIDPATRSRRAVRVREANRAADAQRRLVEEARAQQERLERQLAALRGDRQGPRAPARPRPPAAPVASPAPEERLSRPGGRAIRIREDDD